jgi:Asp-tRNA(Asn)/Glu-tRNA(Gln) amidotransferase C subunit
MTSAMKADETANSLPPEDVLANAPGKEAAYFRIRAVLE